MYKNNSRNNSLVNLQEKVFNINGTDYIFNSAVTILDLINYLGFNKNVIVIDYNGIILEKSLWYSTNLKNKDRLEILSIAGGG